MQSCYIYLWTQSRVADWGKETVFAYFYFNLITWADYGPKFILLCTPFFVLLLKPVDNLDIAFDCTCS